AIPQESTEMRLFAAEFLCSAEDNAFLNHFKPHWNALIQRPLTEKLDLLRQELNVVPEHIFPFSSHFSQGMEAELFFRSLLIQPDLFIRLNEQNREAVMHALQRQGIPFREIGLQTLALPNGTPLEKVLQAEQAVSPPPVVQDLSSQSTAAFFQAGAKEYWWDACAASGGKSLLLHSIQPDIQLLVSDIRESVLNNLDERFQAAGIASYHKKVLDLSESVESEMHHYLFDGIILDAPCTGSGIWCRTPEMISQFQESDIAVFSTLQYKIASNVVKYLKPGKALIYITCSVFREENEAIRDYLCQEWGMIPERSGLIKGYEQKADTMYAARLIKA